MYSSLHACCAGVRGVLWLLNIKTEFSHGPVRKMELITEHKKEENSHRYSIFAKHGEQRENGLKLILTNKDS